MVAPACRAVPTQAGRYRLAVTNSMPHPMEVSFRDTTEHALGTLAAQQRQVFAIAAAPAVQVMWRYLKGHEGGWMVTFRPDTIVEVTF